MFDRLGLITPPAELTTQSGTMQYFVFYYYLLPKYDVLHDPLALQHDSSNVTLARYLHEGLVTAIGVVRFVFSLTGVVSRSHTWFYHKPDSPVHSYKPCHV